MALFVIPGPGFVIENDTVSSPNDRVMRQSATPFLGNGLLRPFRRDQKNDFANGADLELIKACVGQVLGTRCSSPMQAGELPWNPEFGSQLYRLRHMKNDDSLRDLGRVYVVDALRRWEPRVRIKVAAVKRAFTTDGGENVLSASMKYDVINRNVPGNQVLFSNVDQTVRF